MLNFNTAKRDIRNGIYEVIDGEKYGDYSVSLLNEGEKSVIIIEDEEGKAVSAIDNDTLLSYTRQDFRSLLNNILYYGYTREEIPVW